MSTQTDMNEIILGNMLKNAIPSLADTCGFENINVLSVGLALMCDIMSEGLAQHGKVNTADDESKAIATHELLKLHAVLGIISSQFVRDYEKWRFDPIVKMSYGPFTITLEQNFQKIAEFTAGQSNFTTASKE